MEIRPATLQDCRGIAQVHVLAWQHAYRDLLPAPFLAALSVDERESMWRRVQAQPSTHLLVAADAGQVAGFVCFGAARDPGTPVHPAEIHALYVAPERWSAGIGRQLWLAASRQIRAEGGDKVALWVVANNQRAIRFYERCGLAAVRGSRRRVELGGIWIEESRYAGSAAD